MDLTQIIQPGMFEEMDFVVEENFSASTVGSGALRVLATPILIARMESVSHRLLADRLPDGYSSVGVLVNVRHLAPTPIGSTVQVRCEAVEVDGMRVTFNVRAWDQSEPIGEGQHQRMVVDEARFLRRVANKSEALEQKEQGT